MEQVDVDSLIDVFRYSWCLRYEDCSIGYKPGTLPLVLVGYWHTEDVKPLPRYWQECVIESRYVGRVTVGSVDG